MSEIIMKNDVLVHVKPVLQSRSLSGRLWDPAPGSGSGLRLQVPAPASVRIQVPALQHWLKLISHLSVCLRLVLVLGRGHVGRGEAHIRRPRDTVQRGVNTL